MKPKYKIGQVLRSSELPHISIKITDVDITAKKYYFEFSENHRKDSYIDLIDNHSNFKLCRHGQLNLL